MTAFLLTIVAALLEAGGSGPKDTQIFEIKRAGWQVEWEGRDVRIYVLNDQNQIMFIPANGTEPKRTSSAVPLDAGRYYLRVSGQAWKVKVVE